MRSSLAEILAEIKLNYASVEQFLAIACGLGDDNPAIRSGVYEAAEEVRAATLLIDHLRSLFSHQQAIEHQNQFELVAGLQQPLAAPQQQQNAGHQRNLQIFSYSNQSTLLKAAKCLVANVAKVLYLTDAAVWGAQEAADANQENSAAAAAAAANLQPNEQRYGPRAPLRPLSDNAPKAAAGEEHLAAGERLDNVANYSQLLRSFSELSGQLVDLGQCLTLARGPRRRRCDAKFEVGAGEPAQRTPTKQLPAPLGDMQTLFQVNRLIMDRSILLLLSASKCCLRQHAGQGQYLHGLAARRSVAGQIRVSMSIIMAVVKCAVFGAQAADEAALGLPAAHQAAADWPAPLATGAEQQQQQRAGAHVQRRSNEIIGYFLQSFGGAASAHDSIVRLQLAIEPFAQVASQDELCARLDEALLRSRAHRRPSADGHTDGRPHQVSDDNQVNDNNNKPRANSDATQAAALFDHETPPVLLMDKRQLVRALNLVFLGESRAQLIERLHEFTDCAYTRHEHRQSIVLLLACIKLQLNKFVRLVYRLRRRASTPTSECDQFNQLRQLACHLVDTCAELNYELQTAVIEQSDELDRSNAQLDLIKQLKHHCSVGDVPKTRLCSGQFHEQSEQLVEVCRMLNQVAATNKLKIMTKTLAIWFELNLGQLLGAAQCLSENPRSRQTKDFAWGLIQVWCSFYDDFCQLARQVAYLAHSQFDSLRAARVGSIKEQVMARQQHQQQQQQRSNGDTQPDQFVMSRMLAGADGNNNNPLFSSNLNDSNNSSSSSSSLFFGLAPPPPPAQGASSRANSTPTAAPLPAKRDHTLPDGEWRSIGSVQSLDRLVCGGNGGCASAPVQQLHQQPHSQQQPAFGGGPASEPPTDSPRSLDHYYGFGANYQRHRCCQQQQAQEQLLQEVDDELLLAAQQRPARRIEQVVDETAALIDHFEADSSRQRRGRAFDAWQDTPTPVFEQSGFVSLDGGPRVLAHHHQQQQQYQLTTIESAVDDFIHPPAVPLRSPAPLRAQRSPAERQAAIEQHRSSRVTVPRPVQVAPETADDSEVEAVTAAAVSAATAAAADQQSVASTAETNADKWSDSEADAIVRGARETAQMALSMYQFTRGEGELNTTQDLFTQAELFAEEANELYKEVRCFSYKVPAGDLKKALLTQLSAIPALVQQLQFIVKNPTVGKAATFAKVDSVIRETRNLMEAVNRVVDATLSCRQHYNMAIASMRKRTRTLSPSYRADKGAFEFDSGAGGAPAGGRAGAFGGRGAGGGSMGSEPDI